MKGTMIRVRDIIGILFACVVIRAVVEIYVVGDNYFLSLANQAAMYLWMLVLIYTGLANKADFLNGFRIGRIGRLDWIKLSATPFALISFSLGSIALTAYLFARIDPAASYAHYGFYVDEKVVRRFLSWHVILYLVTNGVVAPLAEEIVFRKFLLGAISQRWGVFAGVILSSIAFSLLHFGSTDYLGVIVFSVTLSVVFIRFNSVLVCAAIHSSYNVIAFVHQYYFDTFWKREVAGLGEASQWMPHLLLLPVSSVLILWFVVHWSRQQGSRR